MIKMKEFTINYYKKANYILEGLIANNLDKYGIVMILINAIKLEIR